MFKSWLITVLSHPFFTNITATVYTPTSFAIQWDTVYPSTWSVVSDMCDKDPVHVVRTGSTVTPYRVSALFHDCIGGMQQKFVVRNDDLDMYNMCVLDTLANTYFRNHKVLCDYMYNEKMN